MIDLLKFTYLMDLKKIETQLDTYWTAYQNILNREDASWEDINEARAILFIVGQLYCEQIAVSAIERRLHLLSEKMTLGEFLLVCDSKQERLNDLRKDPLFTELERFYSVIKRYKNKDVGGKYYHDEERFIEKYNSLNPNKELGIRYKGRFGK